MNININNLKYLNTEMIMHLSACIDKMKIGQELKKMEVNTGDSKKDNEELSKQLLILIISKIYKAKDEIYEMIASYKDITVEEAKKIAVIPIIQEILGIEGTADFLS